jgi:hypothetical protein
MLLLIRSPCVVLCSSSHVLLPDVVSGSGEVIDKISVHQFKGKLQLSCKICIPVSYPLTPGGAHLAHKSKSQPTTQRNTCVP